MIQYDASLHEKTVQAASRGEIDLPRRRQNRVSRSSPVVQNTINPVLMAEAKAIVARKNAAGVQCRLVIENREVWIR